MRSRIDSDKFSKGSSVTGTEASGPSGSLSAGLSCCDFDCQAHLGAALTI